MNGFETRRWLAAAAAACALGARAETNVFHMPLLQPRHRQLQQQLAQSVRAGKIDEMEAVCREGVALLPRDPTWQYNLACALAYRADPAAALEALERAIALGFRDRRHIEADTDLKRLAALPRFRELAEQAGRLAGQPVEGAVAVAPSTVLMGLPAEVHATNTVWDFEQGCFRTLFNLVQLEIKKRSAYASAYSGPAAERVRAWLGEETAAGNFGDLYVNRDDGHSRLAVTNFPGLTPVVYGPEARAQRAHVSLPNGFFEPQAAYAVLGNCSMSMTSGPYWRSLPRAIVTDPYQAVSAFRFFAANQCWFYPEHKDYDPETGDLYPANTPYYVVSQGSSYSDQPFLKAFAAALAAFRPEVKRALLARRLALAPTLQMLLRATQKTLRRPEDYLTGAAHPAVFDAAQLDVEAMVERAHALTIETIPPLVALRTVADAQPVAGVDYFDVRPEGLFDTPCCLARVVRGVARERRMTVEAASSGPGEAPAFLWRVLQGDPGKVAIRPLNDNASRVEITVAYHGTFRPSGPDGAPAARQTGRVDIGCFVRAGEGYSAPSFVCFYYLPNEERVYRDDGQILSVDYRNEAHRYADPLLTLEKGWKDLYEYDAKGRLIGWYRTRGDANERFTHAGHRVLETDAQNRARRACAVQYMPRQSGGQQAPPTLACADTPQVFEYVYADAEDRVGKPAAAAP